MARPLFGLHTGLGIGAAERRGLEARLPFAVMAGMPGLKQLLEKFEIPSEKALSAFKIAFKVDQLNDRLVEMHAREYLSPNLAISLSEEQIAKKYSSETSQRAAEFKEFTDAQNAFLRQYARNASKVTGLPPEHDSIIQAAHNVERRALSAVRFWEEMRRRGLADVFVRKDGEGRLVQSAETFEKIKTEWNQALQLKPRSKGRWGETREQALERLRGYVARALGVGKAEKSGVTKPKVQAVLDWFEGKAANSQGP